MIEFPSYLGCWVYNGYSSVMPQAKQYLGNKIYKDELGTINATFTIKDEVALNALTIWWMSDANYGINPFSIKELNYMGMNKEIMYVSDSDLAASATDIGYDIQFKLRIPLVQVM